MFLLKRVAELPRWTAPPSVHCFSLAAFLPEATTGLVAEPLAL